MLRLSSKFRKQNICVMAVTIMASSSMPVNISIVDWCYSSRYLKPISDLYINFIYSLKLVYISSKMPLRV